VGRRTGLDTVVKIKIFSTKKWDQIKNDSPEHICFGTNILQISLSKNTILWMRRLLRYVIC
jgi:hypothetical protein